MTSNPLASSWAKLSRAKDHADALDFQLAEATDSDKHPLTFDRQFEPETVIKIDGKMVVHVVFSIATIPTFTSDHAVLLGDALHNFRSALDHLAWALVKRGRAKLNAKTAKTIAFPMVKVGTNYRSLSESRYLPGVDSKLLTKIERYQPYRRTSVGRTMRTLGNLSDTDKHRFLIPSFTVEGSGSHAIEVQGCEGVGPIIWHMRPDVTPTGQRRVHRLKPGAKFVEQSVSFHSEFEVDVKGAMTVVPILSGTWDYVVFELERIGATCTEILSEFEVLL
jgi:hypothetical protein